MSDNLTVAIIISDGDWENDHDVDYEVEMDKLEAFCKINDIVYRRDDTNVTGWFYGIWVSEKDANYILLTKGDKVEVYKEVDRIVHNALTKLTMYEVKCEINNELLRKIYDYDAVKKVESDD